MKTGFIALLAAAAVFTAGPAFADGCDAVVAAQLKGGIVPTHSVFTVTMQGQTFTFENISVDGKIYSHKKDGTWKSEAGRSETDIRKAWANETCVPDGSETIDGDLADIVRNDTMAGTIAMSSRFWISRSSGLVLKTETAMRNSLITAVYDYRDVQLPPEAQMAAP